MKEESTFRFAIPGKDVPPDSLGVWQTGSADAQAFSTGGEPETTLWEIDLPGDPYLAIGALDLQLANLKLSQASLPYASRRLDQFVSDVSTGRLDWGESFAAGEDGVPPAESDLYQLVLAEQADRRRPAFTGEDRSVRRAERDSGCCYGPAAPGGGVLCHFYEFRVVFRARADFFCDDRQEFFVIDAVERNEMSWDFA